MMALMTTDQADYAEIQRYGHCESSEVTLQSHRVCHCGFDPESRSAVIASRRLLRCLILIQSQFLNFPSDGVAANAEQLRGFDTPPPCGSECATN